MPGGFSKGNGLISQNISVSPSSDVIVYIGCNEKGSEIGEVIQNFGLLSGLHKNNKISLMQKSVILANASNMSIISREASIYTGSTVA